jgi:tetratricopeptide (TPR) repeat protein
VYSQNDSLLLETENQTNKSLSEIFSVAGKYFTEQNYKMAIVEYERCFYNSTSREISYHALKQKALSYKLLGDYLESALTLERIAIEYEDYYQIALCYYLSNNFAKTIETITKCELYFDTIQENILLLKVLALNEVNNYKDAQLTAEELANKIESTLGKDIKPLIDSLYSDLPKLKSERIATKLAYFPPLAHFYANQYANGLIALGLNAIALGFGVWQIVDKCYLTAYIVGFGALTNTYPGTKANGVQQVKKYNYKKTRQFNDNFKQTLLQRLQDNILSK